MWQRDEILLPQGSIRGRLVLRDSGALFSLEGAGLLRMASPGAAVEALAHQLQQGRQAGARGTERALDHHLKVALDVALAHRKHFVLHILAVQRAVVRQHLECRGVGSQLVVGIAEVGVAGVVEAGPGVALAAGFGSVRRFNAVFRGLYGRAPSTLRRGPAGVASGPRVISRARSGAARGRSFPPLEAEGTPWPRRC